MAGKSLFRWRRGGIVELDATRILRVRRPGEMYVPDAEPPGRGLPAVVSALSRVRKDESDTRRYGVREVTVVYGAREFCQTYGLLSTEVEAGAAESAAEVCRLAAVAREAASLTQALHGIKSDDPRERKGGWRRLREWNGRPTDALGDALVAAAKRRIARVVTEHGTRAADYVVQPTDGAPTSFARVAQPRTLSAYVFAALADRIADGVELRVCDSRECHAAFAVDDARRTFCSTICRERERYLKRKLGKRHMGGWR